MRLRNPAPGRQVTSPFGMRRHPIRRVQRMHTGIDWGGSFLVLVAATGVAVKIGYSAFGLGHYVIIQHLPNLRTVYAHGVAQSKLVQGARVASGAVVFTSGSTGVSTGNHLHFEVLVLDRFRRWVQVDPAPYFTVNDSKMEEEEMPLPLFYVATSKSPSGFVAVNSTWVRAEPGQPLKALTHGQASDWRTSLGIVDFNHPNLIGKDGAWFDAAFAEDAQVQALNVQAHSWLATLGGRGDLAPVLNAISAVPTAAQNGAAARAAIVK